MSGSVTDRNGAKVAPISPSNGANTIGPLVVVVAVALVLVMVLMVVVVAVVEWSALLIILMRIHQLS
jgi:hypothetical protein